MKIKVMIQYNKENKRNIMDNTTTQKEKELLELSKNQFYFSVTKMVNEVGIENYKMLKTLLGATLNKEQLQQLNQEEFKIENLIYEKLRENPFDLDFIDNIGGDSKTDLVKGLLSKGEEFLKKFLGNDKEVHESIDITYSNELFGYIIPNKTNEVEFEKTIENIEKVIKEGEEFKKELMKAVELADGFKEKIKNGVNFLIEILEKTKNDELEVGFDPEIITDKIKTFKENERFCQPIYNKLDIRNGIFHAGWKNLTNDYLRNKKINDLNNNINDKELFKDFNSKYIKAYKENDLDMLTIQAKKFNDKFEQFNTNINAKIENNEQANFKSSKQKMRK